MREKSFSGKLRGVLFEAAHYLRMGVAIWLDGWQLLWKTHRGRPVGWMLGARW